MKRFQLFSLASAMLLASAAGFTSCSSDSEDPQAGGSGVAGQVVKTQFVINIPYAGNESGGNARVSTRMTAENTQNSNNFLGLQDMELFAFENEPGTANANTPTKAINLGKSGYASSRDEWRSIYRDVAIPVNTKYLVMYARASKDNANSGTKSEFEVGSFEAGSLTNPYANDPTTILGLDRLNFELNTIHTSDDFNSKGDKILNALNLVANTSIDITEGESTSKIKWAAIGDSNIGTQNERTALQERYKEFVKMKAGSANSVRLLITDLKKVIVGKGLSDTEEGKDMARKIVSNCDDALNNYLMSTNEFPRDLGLPDGVAKVEWNATDNKFNFVKATNTTVTTGNNINFTEITYPAELAYFISSPVKTSQDEITAVQHLPNYQEWTAGTADWTTGNYKNVVENRTRFVALENALQYGVACLKSTIKCESNTLIDNAKEFDFDENNSITVGNNFKVTGILIGGQPKKVSWNFEPAADMNNTDFKYTIYDNYMNGIIYAKDKNETATSNYTLVLDNNETNNKNSVYVTIELENNVESFYGADGLIPKGSKFYLVGQLDPNASTGVNKPSGSAETLDHVFIKDHTTIANFTIKNLQKAYNHIPDMRTSKINVGLAVDLSWQEGITFNVDL